MIIGFIVYLKIGTVYQNGSTSGFDIIPIVETNSTLNLGSSKKSLYNSKQNKHIVVPRNEDLFNRELIDYSNLKPKIKILKIMIHFPNF